MIQLREQYWAYPVPVGTEGAEIRGEHPGRPYQLLSFYGEADAVDLPPGNWGIVCTSKEVTEDLLADIIPELIALERFGNYCGDYPVWYHSRKESFRSLLTSKGCDLNNNWLILKKQ